MKIKTKCILKQEEFVGLGNSGQEKEITDIVVKILPY